LSRRCGAPAGAGGSLEIVGDKRPCCCRVRKLREADEGADGERERGDESEWSVYESMRSCVTRAHGGMGLSGRVRVAQAIKATRMRKTSRYGRILILKEALVNLRFPRRDKRGTVDESQSASP